MKINRLIRIILILISSAILYENVISCPYCTQQFYSELFSSRSNSMVAQELLRAIYNQSNSQNSFSPELSSIVNPASFQATPPDTQKNGHKEFIEIINRDNSLSIPPTSYMPQNSVPDKKVSIELSEGEYYIGNGVIYKGFLTNGTIPGPTIVVEEGDIVEFTVVNKGNVPHGASIHAAYTQTSKYLGKIAPGTSKTILFKVTIPGVYMYHCAPGGHAIPMHVIFGQYGMMVVKPKKKYKLEEILNKPPDVEIFLNQHEFYSSGKDAVEGKPMYVTFNGKIFRYVEEPIKAKPGDYVRIYFLNNGPNLLSTFHIVGIIWDFAYWQGNPDVVYPGGQSVTAGPADSWVIEFRVPPDEGAYTMLSHVVGSTDRGAIGLLVSDDSASTPVTISGTGPVYSESEMKDIKEKAKRMISPFEPGSHDVDPPVLSAPGENEMIVKIIGNSFSPKVIQVPTGTKVKWVNEDVFTYLDGEFAGIHNVASYEGGPQAFSSNLLAHSESFTFEFTEEGQYKYMCTPHPYMRGVVIVKDMGGFSGSTSTLGLSLLFVILGLIILMLAALVWDNRSTARKQRNAPKQ